MNTAIKVDLEQDLLKNEWINNKCKSSRIYSQNLYAALCNNRFFCGDEEWTCSWRYAGSIISNIRNCSEDYMAWYCSGAGNTEGYVVEGFVTEEIRLDLLRLGWFVKPYENNAYEPQLN